MGGWVANKPLGLDFHVFETVVCLATVIMVNFVIHDGESNWLQGLMLLVVYFLVAIAFIEHNAETGRGHPVFCWTAERIGADLPPTQGQAACGWRLAGGGLWVCHNRPL